MITKLEAKMYAYRVEVTVGQDGSIVLKEIPFQAGTRVEVIVLGHFHTSEEEARYPLRGKPVQYLAPLEGVAQDEWEVLQ